MGCITVIKSWSFSRYNTYQLCPLKARLAFIDKIPEPGNEAMARGAEVHVLAEQFIKGELEDLPPVLNKFRKEFRRLRRKYKKSRSLVTVEDTWAFTKDWDQTTWNDWVGCWLRVKLDCAEEVDGDVLVIYDWKTGKFRPDKNEEYVEQLELYALSAFFMYDHIKAVQPRLVYLDEGVVFPEKGTADAYKLTFSRDDIESLRKKWEKRTKPMLSDQVFSPRPNNLCRWCHYRKSNALNGGGQCQF